MKSYLDILSHVLENGVEHEDRTGFDGRGILQFETCSQLVPDGPFVNTAFLRAITGTRRAIPGVGRCRLCPRREWPGPIGRVAKREPRDSIDGARRE